MGIGFRHFSKMAPQFIADERHQGLEHPEPSAEDQPAFEPFPAFHFQPAADRYGKGIHGKGYGQQK